MKKYFKKIIILTLIFVPISVFASPPPFPLIDEEYIEITSNFRNALGVEGGDLEDIKVPTVVEVRLYNIDTKNQSFLVYDKDDEEFIASLLVNNYSSNPKTFSVNNGGNNLYSINDNNYSSSETFSLSENGQQGEVSLSINYQEKIKTNEFILNLDNYVSYPNSITISYFDGNGNKNIIASDVKVFKSEINFPEVISDRFLVEIRYTQPLRITELSFNDLDLVSKEMPGLRFLAKPGHGYVIYFNSDRYPSVDIKETPNLSEDKDVLKVRYTSFNDENPTFVESDIDNDGVIDKLDNCVRESNSDQEDIDGNGRGDACDDFDRDGVINSKDNCINDTNRMQSDEDADGIGDACDEEESRLTEKYPIIVWGGIITALLVFVGLYLTAFRKMKLEDNEDNLNQD